MSHDAADPAAALRSVPSVDHLLRHATIAPLLDEHPRGEVLAALRGALDAARDEIRAGRAGGFDVPVLALRIREQLRRREQPHLRRVINATGIVLHTGLGRAPLAEAAVSALVDVAAGYCNLELDLRSGERGDRHEHVRELLRELCGAEDALVVNNNAAATLLALATLARGRGVVVSRGQLVEIGGSYRMPEVMAAAGCRMIEVGTTNRTRIADYERAIDLETNVLLHVHTSNYRIRGFVEETPLGELAALARSRGLHLVDDLGSGLLRELPAGDGQPPWDEPTVRQSVADGADVTLFSGDKLLGGPQAGILVGRRERLREMRDNPLMRALRPDKLTLAALEATLRLYRDPAALRERLPVLRMLTRPAEELEAVAAALARRLGESLAGAAVDVVAGESFAGGGSLPTTALASRCVRVREMGVDAGRVAAALREHEPAVVCRTHDGALLFDPRTIGEDEIDEIAAALAEAARDARAP